MSIQKTWLQLKDDCSEVPIIDEFVMNLKMRIVREKSYC